MTRGVVLLAVGLAGCVTARGGDAPLELVDQHLYVQTMIQGHGPYRLLVDTGSQMTVLATDTARELGLTGWGDRVRLHGVGEKSKRVAETVVGPLEVGGAMVSRVDVLVAGIRGQTNVDGILGCSFFKEFRVVVDYPRAHITFVR